MKMDQCGRKIVDLVVIERSSCEVLSEALVFRPFSCKFFCVYSDVDKHSVKIMIIAQIFSVHEV